MSTITLKIATSGYNKSFSKTLLRDDNLNRLLSIDDGISEGFYFKYDSELIAILKYIGDSRIDGYPMFRIDEKFNSDVTLSNCELWHKGTHILYTNMELITDIDRLFMGC